VVSQCSVNAASKRGGLGGLVLAAIRNTEPCQPILCAHVCRGLAPPRARLPAACPGGRGDFL